MICYILDDQFWKSIYEWLCTRHTDRDFPIQENVLNPLLLKDEILARSPDYILLDNFFPNREYGREEPLWNDLLADILPKLRDTKVICISDYWTRLLDQYDAWERWYTTWSVVWFVDTKNAHDIDVYLEDRYTSL